MGQKLKKNLFGGGAPKKKFCLPKITQKCLILFIFFRKYLCNKEDLCHNVLIYEKSTILYTIVWGEHKNVAHNFKSLGLVPPK